MHALRPVDRDTFTEEAPSAYLHGLLAVLDLLASQRALEVFMSRLRALNDDVFILAGHSLAMVVHLPHGLVELFQQVRVLAIVHDVLVPLAQVINELLEVCGVCSRDICRWKLVRVPDTVKGAHVRRVLPIEVTDADELLAQGSYLGGLVSLLQSLAAGSGQQSVASRVHPHATHEAAFFARRS